MEFDITKFAGRWYELAHIPTDFENDMTRVTADYSILENGDIEVINTGFVNGEQRTITGVAKLTEDKYTLKLSFPYSTEEFDYKIIALSKDYEYAIIGSGDKDKLWILGRKPYTTPLEYAGFLNVAIKNGYDISKIKITKHHN